MIHTKVIRYSIKCRGRIFAKGYGFLLFGKNIGKTFAKNINENLSDRYNKKLVDHAKQYTRDAPKTTSKRVIQKIAISNW